MPLTIAGTLLMRHVHSRRVLVPFVPIGLAGRLFSGVLNHALRGQVLREQLDALDGKVVSLRATDLPLQFTFRIQERRLEPATHAVADVTVRAAVRDFVALARREEDPDTLFFQRRLSVEGATEAGLCLKNLLDGFTFDLDAHCRDILPAPVASLLMHVLRSCQAARARNHRSIRPIETPRA